MYQGVPEEPHHGHTWTVSEDWEASSGLTHDIFFLESPRLLARFAEEPLYTSILRALFELDHGVDERERKKAKHRAKEYMVEAGKLWRIADGRRPRAMARVEVVTQDEMTELAREEHERGGHYKRDMIKTALLDNYSSTRVDQSIINGI
ncbi:hypothetical protein FIBSPDRAFT_762940, partial [Athelia psychrophila]